MKQSFSSIKFKLLRLVMITSSVVSILTCSVFFAYEFYTYRGTTRDQLATLGKIIADNSTAALAFQSQNDANEILDALKAEPHIVAACLYDKQGNLFAKYPLNLPDSTIPRQPFANGYNYNNAMLEGFEPVIQKEQRVGTLYLQSDMKGFYEKFRLYSLVTISVIIITIVVAYLISRRLQKTVSDPILSLAQAAVTVSNEQDYSIRAKKYYNDELGELTDAFNKMLSQIEQQNAEIISLNHHLEAKVNERTCQLEQANTELKLKNEFVEKIIDSSVDLVVVLDSNLNYVLINRYAQEVYGLDPQTVIGKNILDVYPEISRAPIYKDLQKSLLGEIIHNPYYKSPISGKILENYYIPLPDKDGNTYNLLIIGHDITQKMEASEKLGNLNAALAKSNRDLEQFAYVASHDLQEPLRKIQTYSSLLEKALDDKEASGNYISRIINSVVRMRELIKSILHYSQASNVSGNFEMVDLNEIIENIKVDYELAIEEKDAVIIMNKLALVKGDKLQLNQLFLNLVSNSLKFSNRKPVIKIHGTVVDEHTEKEQDPSRLKVPYLKITFEDNGIGFEQQFGEKIFTIFQRLHNRKEYPGTGIGLALCKKIVENHKGRISVQSTPGEGTIFDIHLPLVPPAHVASILS